MKALGLVLGGARLIRFLSSQSPSSRYTKILILVMMLQYSNVTIVGSVTIIFYEYYVFRRLQIDICLSVIILPGRAMIRENSRFSPQRLKIPERFLELRYIKE